MRIARSVAGGFPVLALAFLLATVEGAASSAVAGSAHPPSALRVFAAASLAGAFGDMAQQFEQEHPGISVQLNLAGSQQLAAQLQQGAAADVFASADQRWMDELRDQSLLAEEPREFARNRLVVIVPRTNPARIGKLQDLARTGVKVVIGAESVPVGKYSREALQNLSRADGFRSDYARRVLTNVVSEEENVKSVVAKVQLGEADAGIVYRSDVTPTVSRYVRRIEIPNACNVLASYPIAIVKGSSQPAAALDFITLVLSPTGQRVLERWALIPVLTSP